MKSIISLVMLFSLVLASLPSYSLEFDADTPVFLYVGSGTEAAQEYINEKIDLAPIKLPEKVGNFELLEAERALAPNILKDQIGLWSAPLRVKFRDLVWLLPASGVLTTLLLVDDDFSQVLTNNNNPSETQDNLSKAFAQVGGYAPVLGFPGGLILTGYITKNDRLRETGVLQYEALGNAAIIGTVAQTIAGRKKPNNLAKEQGRFFRGGSSFPSGHSIAAFTLASVAAHQYPDKKWVAFLGYTTAAVISASRILQNTHYPADAFAGAVTGYLLGKYIVKHRSQFSPKYKDKKEKQQQ